MKITFDYLMTHKEEIQVVFSIVVGIATIITSFVNVYLVKCQLDINKEQTALQKSQNQPIFDIYQVKIQIYLINVLTSYLQPY